jgi:hypothetical protein
MGAKGFLHLAGGRSGVGQVKKITKLARMKMGDRVYCCQREKECLFRIKCGDFLQEFHCLNELFENPTSTVIIA